MFHLKFLSEIFRCCLQKAIKQSDRGNMSTPRIILGFASLLAHVLNAYGWGRTIPRLGQPYDAAVCSAFAETCNLVLWKSQCWVDGIRECEITETDPDLPNGFIQTVCSCDPTNDWDPDEDEAIRLLPTLKRKEPLFHVRVAEGYTGTSTSSFINYFLKWNLGRGVQRTASYFRKNV